VNDTPPRSGLIAPVKALSSDEARLEPFAWYQTMRDTNPVAFDPERDCWDVFRYEDVHRILQNHTTFSSDRRAYTQGAPIPPNILSMDPPKHTQLRSLVSQAFTPKAIAGLAPRITGISRQLLEAVLEAGEMDVIGDFAYPLPVIVIAELLGVPAEDRALFKNWSDILVKGTREISDAAILELRKEKFTALMELVGYFANILNRRRNDPQDDLITALLHAEVDGQQLAQDEIISFCILLLAAGNETTTNLIANAVRCFTTDAACWERLASETSLLPGAIEETLRYRSPVQATNRFATADVQIGGQWIRKGQQVVAWIGSANRDERKFPEASEWVIDRNPNPHLAFGQGIHFCLGAPLARLEAHIALSMMIGWMRDLEITDVPLEPVQSGFVYGVKHLPVRFTIRNRPPIVPQS
jgi:cytochrome P450